MKYYVDGHNVLGSMGMPGDSKSIQTLIAKLSAYQSFKKVEVVLVFDNKTNREPYSLYERRGNLRVYASDPNIDRDADDWLVRKLEHDPEASVATIVTRDNGLKDRLRGVGAKNFMDPERFMEIVDSAHFAPAAMNAAVQDDSKSDDLTDSQRNAITEEMSRIFGSSDQR